MGLEVRCRKDAGASEALQGILADAGAEGCGASGRTQMPGVRAWLPSFLPGASGVPGNWLKLRQERGLLVAWNVGGGGTAGGPGEGQQGRGEARVGIRPLGAAPGLWNMHTSPPAVPGNQGADCSPICSLTFHSREGRAGG